MLKPNIVLIFADQLRRDALGCYGNTICKTPNLDALATRGCRFDQAYTTVPVCSPSRTSLLTGKFPHEHGLLINTHLATTWKRGLDLDAETFVGPLKEAGYCLDYIGKWHVSQDHDPCAYGFDRYDKSHPHRPNIREGSRLTANMPYGSASLAAVDENDNGRLASECNQALEWIRERANGDQPFFLRVDHQEPHFPCEPPARFADQYKPSDIPPCPSFADDLSGKPESHRSKRKRWGLDNAPCSLFAESKARYYAVVSALDEQVGRVMALFDELDLWSNSMLVVCCDHGDAQGSHGHIEKSGTMYEEIFRLPLLIAGPPELVRSGSCDAFVRLQFHFIIISTIFFSITNNA